MTTTAFVFPKVEVAFASAPLATTPTWTDVTRWVRHLNIRRGKSHELGQQQPGVCTVLLDDRDRRFDPTNTSSPYSPNVLPMRKLRVSAIWPDIGLSSRLVGTNFLTYQDSSIEDDNAGSWVGAVNATVLRDGGTSSDGVASLRVTAVANGDVSAQTATGTGGYAVAPGVQHTALFEVRSQATGRFGNAYINWYTLAGTLISQSASALFSDNSVSWTQVHVTATAPANAAFAAVQVYWLSAVAAERHYIDKVSLATGSSTTWTAGYKVYYLFTGYAEAWPLRWPDVSNSQVEVTAVDGLKVLNLRKVAGSFYRTAVLADSPGHYWPFNDPLGEWPAATEVMGTTDNAGLEGGWTLGAVGANALDTDTAIDEGQRTGWELVSSSAAPLGTGNFTIEAWVHPRSVPATFDTIIEAQRTGSTLSADYWQFVIMPDFTLSFAAFGGGNGGSLTSSVALTPNAWNHVAAVKSGTTGPGSWKMYLNGVDVTGTPSTTGTGNCNLVAWQLHIAGKSDGTTVHPNLDGLLQHLAIYGTALASATIIAHYATTVGGKALTGARVGKILDAVSWPAADRVLDAGQFQMRGVTQPLYTTSALSYLQLLIDSEGYPADLFMDGQGRVVFQDRAHAAPTAAATFGDGAGELPYELGGTTAPVLDDLNIWNAIAYQAENGQVQIATDATSQTAYVSRALSKTGLQNASDADVATVAGALLARYKDPVTRMAALGLHPLDDPNLWGQILGRELNDRITVHRAFFTGGGSMFSLDVRIEGIEHDISPFEWRTTWQLAPT